jgi:hypothetical protein
MIRSCKRWIFTMAEGRMPSLVESSWKDRSALPGDDVGQRRPEARRNAPQPKLDRLAVGFVLEHDSELGGALGEAVCLNHSVGRLSSIFPRRNRLSCVISRRFPLALYQRDNTVSQVHTCGCSH